jgi:hypothetical protein
MTTTKTTKPNLAKRVTINVSHTDITDSECRDPNKCMIKVAVARALRVAHGYIHVDSTGISVTRRKDFREKAFLPRIAAKNMYLFDDEDTAHLVKPFRFTAEFHKTTKVYKSSPERKAQINTRRAGVKRRKYSLHSRVIGLAIPKDLIR